MHYFGVPKFRNKIKHYTTLDPKLFLRVFQSVLQFSGTSNEAKLMFRSWIHYFNGTEVAKVVSQWNQPFYPIRPQTMFESVSEHFTNLRHVKQGKTCVSGLNKIFRSTKVAKIVSERNQPFYPIRPQMMFESVSEHFANLRHVKWGKTYVSGLNALFRRYRSYEHCFAMKSTILPR